MKAFILLSVIALALAREQCGENQHFASCGTACPLTCDNYDNPPKVCVMMCKIGCACNEGYVLTSDGQCVKPEQCPAKAINKKCGENQHFESCGTACPLTCDNYDNPPRACVDMCKIGCACDEGYVLSSDGRCVRPEQCPAKSHQCGENQHFESCGTACPLTCDNYDNPPKICVAMCKIGCACDKGYVLSSDGRCVKPEQCPAKVDQCGENQHFESCGTACPLTCDNYDNPPRACVKMCKIGCACDKGYVRTSDGRCVRPEQCPAKADQCGKNQHFESCGTACPLTCDNYDNPPKICVAMCKIGCACDKGYVLTSDGQCVRPEQCPAKADQCGKNQHFESCGTACPLTCDNYDNPPKICVAMCKIGCACDKGYVRTSDGRCVRPEQCPAKAESICGEHQTYEGCGTACPATCDNYDKPPRFCPAMCIVGCQCEPGYVETTGGRCVKPEDCPARVNHVRQSGSDVCELPSESGLCDAYMPRYFYDSERGECRRFIYGGCGGNGNNFRTIEECQKACGQQAPQACLEPKVVGPCRAGFRRFFFNQETGKCEQFIYGGCQGNANNFKTEEECHSVCSA